MSRARDSAEIMIDRKILVGIGLAALWGVSAIACNSVTGADDLGSGGQSATGGGGASPTSTTAGSGDASTTSATSSTATSTTGSSSSSTTGSSASSGTSSSSSSTTGSSSSSGGGGSDPWAQDRQVCIDKINALRATKGLPPYQRWGAEESCVDEQATHDESVNIAHDAFMHGTPSCGGYAQNECPGWAAGNIAGCLDQMWAEGTQPGCSGCDACDTFTIFMNMCPNCSFYGPPVCGHYVNMSSATFTMAACGFSTDGSWEAIDFE